MITKKLYDEDSHIQAFEAKVLACLPAENGYRVELDQTAFFAEGGGQPSDRGVLAGQVVEDVQEEAGHIYHYIKEPVAAGETMQGQIDWAFRFTNMQQHSGEHILSGIAYAWKGYHNVGFHMNEAVTTIDFDGPLTVEELHELEIRANRVVYANQPVTVVYPSEEELAKLDYRSKKALTGEVRIVKVGEADCCACCAPHVRRTGEIGQIKIISAENYKGGVRLTILCGERALLDYEAKNRLLKELGGRLSVKPEKVKEAVEKQEEELRQMKARASEIAAQLVDYKLAMAQTEGSVCLLEPSLDAVAARNLVNGLTEKLAKVGQNAHAAVLLPKAGSAGEFQYIIGSRTEDVRPLAKELSQRFGGRGGGSSQMVQGTVKGLAEEIAAFLRE